MINSLRKPPDRSSGRRIRHNFQSSKKYSHFPSCDSLAINPPPCVIWVGCPPEAGCLHTSQWPVRSEAKYRNLPSLDQEGASAFIPEIANLGSPQGPSPEAQSMVKMSECPARLA